MSLAKRAEPATLVLSPTLTNPVSGAMVRGSRPLSRQCFSIFGTLRGATEATASTMAAMWAGVVPQQPPTMFTRPLSANSPSWPAMYSGVSSYSPNSLGRPALG